MKLTKTEEWLTKTEEWMLEIAISDFMKEDAPGIKGGPSRVLKCFRAIRDISDGTASDEEIKLTKLIHDYYSAWCRRNGQEAIAYPDDLV